MKYLIVSSLVFIVGCQNKSDSGGNNDKPGTVPSASPAKNQCSVRTSPNAKAAENAVAGYRMRTECKHSEEILLRSMDQL